VDRPRPGLGPPRAEHEVCPVRNHRVRNGRKQPRVERAVAVHEAHDLVGGRREVGEASRPEAHRGLPHDPRAQPAISADPSVEPLSTTIGA
jgi:hypothetical protein